MKKTAITLAIATLAALATASNASAGSPTCADFNGTGWKNHGAHVLTYVDTYGSAAGGRPAHLNFDDPDGPPPVGSMAAPGASFCLDANSPRP